MSRTATKPADFNLRNVDRVVMYRALPGSVCYFCEGGKTPASTRTVELRGIFRVQPVANARDALIEKVEPRCVQKHSRTVCDVHRQTIAVECFSQGIKLMMIDSTECPDK